MIRPVLLAALLLFASRVDAAPLRRPALMAYYESWLAPTSGSPFADLPASLDVLALAFARPDAVYDGTQLAGTGLQFSQSESVLRAAVAQLRKANPALRIVLSVGGSSYTGWGALDEHAIARLVRDLGLDGIDVDFEPADPGCVIEPSQVHCRSDAQWAAILRRLRAVLPRPALLTVPGWSVGAYGTGVWQSAAPGGPYAGMMLAPLHDPGAAAIDLVSVMAYDAGSSFKPAQAYAAYRAAWPGLLLGGVAVADGAPALPGPDGLMIYGWLTPAQKGQPSAADIARQMCQGWGRPKC